MNNNLNEILNAVFNTIYDYKAKELGEVYKANEMKFEKCWHDLKMNLILYHDKNDEFKVDVLIQIMEALEKQNEIEREDGN